MNATRYAYGKRITGDKQQQNAAEANKRDALQLLNIMNDYGMSADGLIVELMFNFGYTRHQAVCVYSEWLEAR